MSKDRSPSDDQSGIVPVVVPLSLSPPLTLYSKKVRIDRLLVERGLVCSRHKAQSLIMSGRVVVEGRRVDKAGVTVPAEASITVREDFPYVSRGGIKLAAALEAFQVDPAGMIAMDIGSSTGGFTDCLLKRGAARVIAVDVGYGQLDWSLRQDPRVTVLEKTNIRYLKREAVQEPIDLVVIDVSFISLRLVIPRALDFFSNTGGLIALIKPQFEVGKGEVGKGGVVRDSQKHEMVVREIREFAEKLGLFSHGIICSPISGAKGNVEFLVYFTKKTI